MSGRRGWADSHKFSLQSLSVSISIALFAEEERLRFRQVRVECDLRSGRRVCLAVFAMIVNLSRFKQNLEFLIIFFETTLFFFFKFICIRVLYSYMLEVSQCIMLPVVSLWISGRASCVDSSARNLVLDEIQGLLDLDLWSCCQAEW